MNAGQRIAGYSLLEKLGEGGFGEVWKAERTDAPGQFVAIKIATAPEGVAMLQEAWTLLGRVSHPNVLQAVSLDTASVPPYLVTEFIQGESLRTRLSRDRRIDPGAAVGLLDQVLAGLHAVHGSGDMHRDLKPENVLIREDGTVKLVDFGLGRAVQKPPGWIERSGSTDGPAVVGTYHYMSPEQTKGQPGDHRSDLYACGVILHEMLCGHAYPIKLPIDGVPARLSRVVEKAVSVRPRKRYPSTTAMASAMRDAMREAGASTSIESASSHRRGWPLRREVYLLMAALLVLGVAVWYVGYGPRRARQHAEATHHAWQELQTALQPGPGQAFHPPSALENLRLIDSEDVDQRLAELIQEWRWYYSHARDPGAENALQEKDRRLREKLNEKYGEYGLRF